MKNKPVSRAYLFEPFKYPCPECVGKFAAHWRDRFGHWWLDTKPLSEEEIKTMITQKQFIKFKQGFLGPFEQPPISRKEHNRIQTMRNKHD